MKYREFYAFLPLKGLVAIISSIDSRLAPEADLAIHFCPFAYGPPLFCSRRHVVGCMSFCIAPPSHPMQLVQHAILYSLTRSPTLLLFLSRSFLSLFPPPPPLFFAPCIFVHTGIASFYPFPRATISADATRRGAISKIVAENTSIVYIKLFVT